MLLVLGISFCAFGLLPQSVPLITKSTCKQDGVDIDISFEKQGDDLLRMKFSVPRKSVIYAPIEVIDFSISDKTSGAQVLSLTINYRITKKWVGGQEYLTGECYIARSLLVDEKYIFLLVLYNNHLIGPEVDIRSFYCDCAHLPES